MKKVWGFISKIWNSFWGTVLRYHSHVCLSFILIIIFMLVSLWNNESWGNALLKSEKEKILIQMQFTSELNAANNLIKDQGEFCDFQGEVIDAQRKAIEEQSLTIENQSNILRQLIEYLKAIKHWPPKEGVVPPVDPSRLAGSNAISYDKEKISHIR